MMLSKVFTISHLPVCILYKTLGTIDVDFLPVLVLYILQ